MTQFFIAYPPIHGHRGKIKRNLSNTYGLNAYYAGKHYAERSQDAKFWHLWVIKHLREQGIPKQLYTKPIKITFWWNDGLDVDNHAVMEKYILDALKGYLIHDDNRKYVTGKSSYFYGEEVIKVEVKTDG